MKRLDTCHFILRALFKEVIKHYDCTIICGHRGAEDQTAALIEGASKLPWPQSKHNRLPSLAVDVAPWYKDKPHVRWEDKKKFYHFAGLVLGISTSLKTQIRWGGDWDSDTDLDDQHFMDLVHFEVRI